MDDQQERGPVPDGRLPEAAPPRAGRRVLRWSAGVVAFVVGLVVGGVVVGIVAGRSTPVPPAAAGEGAAAPSTGGSPGPASSSAAATAQVMVNDACLRSINAAQDVYQQLGALADAAQHLDAARLDEVIQQLQPLESRLRASVPDCQVTTKLPDGSVLTGAPGSGAPTTPAAPGTPAATATTGG